MNSRARVKFCGITNVDDAILAANLGVDAIGLVFYPDSSRVVSVTQAREIVTALPAFVTTVGVFVNPAEDFIHFILEQVPLNCLQFHGDEAEDFCSSFAVPYIKALRMQQDINLDAEIKKYPTASSILLDTYQKDKQGGTGKTFDWSRVPNNLTKPIILSGGLTPDNVADAINTVKPYAVDVSGGIESSPGVKDATKMKQFIENV